MGSAIAQGLVKASKYQPSEILLCDTALEKLQTLAAEGFQTTKDLSHIRDLLKNASLELLLIAVKPKDIDGLLAELSAAGCSSKTIIISIAAGIKLSSYAKYFPENPIIRAMPNTPAQVQRGSSVLAPNSKVKHQDLDKAMQIFEALGIALIMDESKLDAVTALSGSGPAYVFYLIEAMVKAGVELGLSQREAQQLSIATAYGASFLAFSRLNQSPIEAETSLAKQLRLEVTSPNGTTHAAISSLEENSWSEILIKAIRAAKDRSIEMA